MKTISVDLILLLIISSILHDCQCGPGTTHHDSQRGSSGAGAVASGSGTKSRASTSGIGAGTSGTGASGVASLKARTKNAALSALQRSSGRREDTPPPEQPRSKSRRTSQKRPRSTSPRRPTTAGPSSRPSEDEAKLVPSAAAVVPLLEQAYWRESNLEEMISMLNFLRFLKLLHQKVELEERGEVAIINVEEHVLPAGASNAAEVEAVATQAVENRMFRVIYTEFLNTTHPEMKKAYLSGANKIAERNERLYEKELNKKNAAVAKEKLTAQEENAREKEALRLEEEIAKKKELTVEEKFAVSYFDWNVVEQFGTIAKFVMNGFEHKKPMYPENKHLWTLVQKEFEAVQKYAKRGMSKIEKMCDEYLDVVPEAWLDMGQISRSLVMYMINPEKWRRDSLPPIASNVSKARADGAPNPPKRQKTNDETIRRPPESFGGFRSKEHDNY